MVRSIPALAVASILAACSSPTVSLGRNNAGGNDAQDLATGDSGDQIPDGASTCIPEGNLCGGNRLACCAPAECGINSRCEVASLDANGCVAVGDFCDNNPVCCDPNASCDNRGLARRECRYLDAGSSPMDAAAPDLGVGGRDGAFTCVPAGDPCGGINLACCAPTMCSPNARCEVLASDAGSCVATGDYCDSNPVCCDPNASCDNQGLARRVCRLLDAGSAQQGG
jgi:hypothetical protein